MSETIVVGVDGSDTALQAATAAARFATALGAKLHIVTAYESDEVEVLNIGSDEFRFSTSEQALGTAQSVATQLREQAPAFEISALQGKPAEVLMAEARRLGSSIIVVRHRTLQRLARL